MSMINSIESRSAAAAFWSFSHFQEFGMIRLMLVDQAGNAITPQELATVADLREAQERARTLIRECERLLDEKAPKPAGRRVPYS